MALTPDNYFALLFSIVIWFGFKPCDGAGVASPPTRADANFYRALDSTGVPRELFGVVWFVLYALIGAANFGFWLDARNSSLYTAGLILFIVNLLLNKAWPEVFFGYRSPSFAFVVIVSVFGTAIALLVIATAALNFGWVAALLLVYVVWLAVATALNAYVWYVYAV